MAILFMLIPISLILVALGCWAFFWAARTGQFEELDAASWDILVDDPSPESADADQVRQP